MIHIRYAHRSLTWCGSRMGHSMTFGPSEEVLELNGLHIPAPHALLNGRYLRKCGPSERVRCSEVLFLYPATCRPYTTPVYSWPDDIRLWDCIIGCHRGRAHSLGSHTLCRQGFRLTSCSESADSVTRAQRSATVFCRLLSGHRTKSPTSTSSGISSGFIRKHTPRVQTAGSGVACVVRRRPRQMGVCGTDYGGMALSPRRTRRLATA